MTKNARAVDSITFVGNALTMRMRLIDGIIRMHFDISGSVTSSNVIHWSLRHRKLKMASLKSMTAKMILQWTPRVVVIRTHNCNWTIIEGDG